VPFQGRFSRLPPFGADLFIRGRFGESRGRRRAGGALRKTALILRVSELPPFAPARMSWLPSLPYIPLTLISIFSFKHQQALRQFQPRAGLGLAGRHQDAGWAAVAGTIGPSPFSYSSPGAEPAKFSQGGAEARDVGLERRRRHADLSV